MAYFFLPIVVLMGVNLTLFVITSLSLHGRLKSGSEFSLRRRRRRKRSQVIIPALTGKLSVIRRHSNSNVQEVNKMKERYTYSYVGSTTIIITNYD